MQPPIVNDAPEGQESFWMEIDGVLNVWVSLDLDDVARQRFIAQAKEEHGLRRGHTAIPVLLAWGGLHRAISRHKTALAAAGAAAAAAGITAVTLPAVMHAPRDDAANTPPSYIAIAPPRPGLPPRRPGPPPPGPPPQGPPPPEMAPTPGETPLRHPLQPIRSEIPTLPPITTPPIPPPPVTDPLVPQQALVLLPRVRRICVTADVLVHARVGCAPRD